ncbi:hypothetical protein MKZ38_003912 [Zalerion maritima]|uniref:Uncharacterized protein n=1 Tax=Zalerion maritima TaxID=339359 RepID=A0AAD5WPY0_9PEZI|nr:hypothetical protein MKZ38_003912 [Zalerion maritima]
MRCGFNYGAHRRLFLLLLLLLGSPLSPLPIVVGQQAVWGIGGALVGLAGLVGTWGTKDYVADKLYWWTYRVSIIETRLCTLIADAQAVYPSRQLTLYYPLLPAVQTATLLGRAPPTTATIREAWRERTAELLRKYPGDEPPGGGGGYHGYNDVSTAGSREWNMFILVQRVGRALTDVGIRDKYDRELRADNWGRICDKIPS